MAAVSCVALTNVVTRACPPKVTVEPETKFVPFTVSVKAPLFTSAEDGAIDEIVGRAFSVTAVMGSKTDIVFCWLLDVAKPGLPKSTF